MKFVKKHPPKQVAIYILLSLLVLTVSAGAQEPAPFDITIELAHDAMPGHAVTTDIVCNGVSALISGFEFLIFVDSDTLGFVDVQPGEFINRCGWQYFTYRYYEAFEIGINTHTDVVKIIAAAQSNIGSGTPDCYLPNEGESLVQLTLKVRPGCGFRCLQSPVRFVWTDCQSNHLTLNSDGSLAVSRFVYDYSGHDIIDITDTNCIFPSLGGSPECCLDNTPPEENRLIDFYNGIVLTGCPDDICIDRGDINCDGIPYESSDVVFLQNMFIVMMSSPEIWPTWDECSIINSDVNADNITLSVADYVYLVRAMAGEVPVYPKTRPIDRTVEIYTRQVAGGTEIRYRSPVDIGGLLIQCELKNLTQTPMFGDATDNMMVEYAARNDHLGVLIYDDKGNVLPAGDALLMTIPHHDPVQIQEVDAADQFGWTLSVKVESSPSRLQVGQNCPNPFNMSTEIALSLPETSSWKLTIFNILGQAIREYSGSDNAGRVSVYWDGCDNTGNQAASGIYFYKVVAGSETQTRKMFLLK